MDHPAVNIGERDVAPTETVSQPLVVESHQVQDRGVQVMDRHHVLYRVHTEFVCVAVNQPLANSAPGHPNGEPGFVVIPSVPVAGVWGPSELRGPDHQCLVEHATSLQVLEQRSDRLVGNPRVALVPFLQFGVLVPCPVVTAVDLSASDFDEANARLNQRRALRHWVAYTLASFSFASRP